MERFKAMSAKRREEMIQAFEQQYAAKKRPELAVLVEHVVADLTKSEAVFRDRDVERRLLDYLRRDIERPPVGMTQEEWKTSVTRVASAAVTKELGNPQRYPTYRGQDGALWRTTLRMQGLEQMVTDAAAHLARQPAPVSPEAQAGAVAAFEAGTRAKGWEVEPEKSAALAMLLGPGGLKVVDGVPGAGKTTMAKAFVEAVQAAGHDVYATAPTSKAAAAIAADTGAIGVQYDDFVALLRQGRVKAGSQIVLDEAGMAGTQRMAPLLDAARRHGVGVAMLGDRQQLPPREAGEPFRAVCALDAVPITLLPKTRRQKDPVDRAAAEALHAGDAAKAIASYADRGRIAMSDDPVAAIAKRYLAERPADPAKAADLLVLAPDAQDARKINLAILEAQGRRPEQGFREGDRVILTSEVKGRQDGKDVIVQGGTTATVLSSAAGLELKVDGNDKATVSLAGRDQSALEHAFALGLRDAQGITAKNALLAVTRPLDRAEALVGLSRHKDTAAMIVNPKIYDSPAAMARDFSRRRDKTMVGDLQALAARRATMGR